jgi:hypothetical protein
MTTLRKQRFHQLTFAAALLLAVPLFAFARPADPQETAGPSVQMVVTAESEHGSAIPTITPQDVMAYQGHDRRPVTKWAPLTGEQAGMQLAILIDDSSTTSLGSQLQDLRAFINKQPATTLVGVGYMANGTVFMAQQFTQDHTAAANALRLPLGNGGGVASPYLSLSDLIKRWPTEPSHPRREVLMITSGIDAFYGNGPQNPYVDAAIRNAQCAGILVYTIYTPGVGHFAHSFWRTYWGQNYLSELSEETGAESYYLFGPSPAVSFTPYLDALTADLTHQFELTFQLKPQTNSGKASVHVATEMLGVDLRAADSVCVPANKTT